MHVCHTIYTVVSGEITTLVVLDYETVPGYYLRIRATDMGSPTLFSKYMMFVSFSSLFNLVLSSR